MRIVAVAIKLEDGQVHSLERPRRHVHLKENMVMKRGISEKETEKGEEGFLTDTGEFADRMEAFQIAKQAGQITTTDEVGFLGSVDIW